MSRILVRVSIPARLRDEMMLMKHASFTIPHTRDGVRFMQTWEGMKADRRDAVMKYAYDNTVTLVDAHRALADAEIDAVNVD